MGTKQLEDLTKESLELRATLEKLRKDNRFLQEQASQSIEEVTDYALYMTGERERRQDQIINVKRKNEKEIETIASECTILNENFNKRLKDLQQELEIKKENLREAEEELESLDHIRIKEEEAVDKIKELENSLEQTRTKHSTEIQQMKADFLNEKKKLSNQADTEILKLSKKATEIASSCLNQHAERIQFENQKLRTELLSLLGESDQLQERKQELEQQYLSYLRENEYLDDLRSMRI